MNAEDARKKALDAFNSDKKDHEQLCSDMERAYRAYRGVLEGGSEADSWNTKYHPAVAFQIAETIVAGLLDPKPNWSLVPTARFDAPPALEDTKMAARQLELLLNQQRRAPGFLRDQRIHRLQALICRLTAKKVQWDFQQRPLVGLESYDEDVYDDYGNRVGSVSKMRKKEGMEIVRDDPKSEVVDVRHLIWPQHAISIEAAPHVTHRLYLSYDEIKRRECKVNDGKLHEGPCKGGYYHNVDELKKRERGSSASEAAKGATDLFSYRPHQDDIEILEFWHVGPDGGIFLTVIGNQEVLLRHQESPFAHGKFPFVVCSGTPYPFRVQGISDIEQLIELQEAVWSMGSQRHDNVKLVNNAIILMREDMDDPDSFDFYPGAKNMVADPQQVVMWTPDVRLAEVSLTAEQLIKRDMEAISGGSQWLSGDQSMNSGGTATEASLMTTLAQRRVAQRRQFFLEADAEEGNQYIELNDQFLSEERYVQIVGEQGFQGWAMIDPDVFREYKFQINIEAMDESLMREQRRAEKQALLQVAASVQPNFVAAAQAGIGRNLNMEAFMDDLLDAHDVRDKDRYYSSNQQAPPQQAGTPGEGSPEANSIADLLGGGGVTNEALAAGPSSPSNEVSMSPVAPMQQMGAMSGPTQ